MERVSLLIDRTGERISCLLNPERLETRRVSGLRRRGGAGGLLTNRARTDDPLIATGGGITEYDLYLLFDVEVAREGRAWASAGGTVQKTNQALAPVDVRELTRPLWDLTENAGADAEQGPPRIRFIWGKSWNVPGVVVAVAERLEQFDANGAPQRSWLSLRLRRVEEDRPQPAEAPAAPPPRSEPEPTEIGDFPTAEDMGEIDRIDVPSDLDGAPLERLDLIAADHYGDPALAAALAAYNGMDDMLRAPPGASLALPPVSRLRGSAA